MCWSRVPRAGLATLSMSGERRVAAQGGAGWRAGAAILFPSTLDGFDSAFVAAVARAQSELWLPMGVARKLSACAELCCVRARDRVCMPHTACESPLRALVIHGRRPRVCVRVVLPSLWPPPPRAGCPPLCVVLNRNVSSSLCFSKNREECPRSSFLRS